MSLRQNTFSTLFLTLFLFIGCSGYESATAVTAANIDNGEQVYNNNGNPGEKCVDCHAANGSGVFGLGSDIRSATAGEISSAVRAGPGLMPAYSTTVITGTELNDLIAYVLTL